MSFKNKDILKTYGVSKFWFSRKEREILWHQRKSISIHFYKEPGKRFAGVPNRFGPKAALAKVRENSSHFKLPKPVQLKIVNNFYWA